MHHQTPRTGILNLIGKFAASRKLTVGLLAYSVILIFIGTLESQFIGIPLAQKKYFESFFCLAFDYIPLAGGASVGLLAVINLTACAFCKARFSLRGLGLFITHIALAALILSGALQFFTRSEGIIVLNNNLPSNEVFVDADNKAKTVVLDFDVRLKEFTAQFWEGSSIPRSYSSRICFIRNNARTEALVNMNSPVSFGGWTFYQNSYSNEGKTSILTAVKNPGRFLPWISVTAVFAGMVMTFASLTTEKGGK